MNPDNITPPQPQLPGHHVSNSMKIVMLLLGLALIATLGYFTWFVGSEQEAAEEVAPSVKERTEDTAATADTQKTYSSAGGYYSFDYPSNQAVYTMSGEGPGSESIAATASSTDVFVGSLELKKSSEGIFFGAVAGMTSLSESEIQVQFSATKPENLTITTTTVGSKDGFKVMVKGDASVVSTFYFTTNSAGKILKFTVLNNNEVAADILASLKIS